MVGAGALLRALLAVVAVLPTLLLLGPAPATAAPARSAPTAAPTTAPTTAPATAPAAAADRTPLEVAIDQFTPSVLPERGVITVRGTVTNVSEETWTTVNLYAILGDDLPAMRTPRELADALAVPVDADVGERITDVGQTGRVDVLEPGDSASFTVTVPVSAVTVTTPGVYWFGIHALGESASTPRDTVADGRARTFLPYLPERFDTESVSGAMVLPISRRVVYDADGAVADPDEWEALLGPRGRLGRVPQVAAAADGVPLTYALDPALFDALGRLARGNPRRSLGPTPAEAEDPDAPPSESPSGSPGDEGSEGDGSDGEGDGDGDAETVDPLGTEETPEQLGADPDSPVARAATAWLDDLGGTLAGSPVMTLPYGNPDLPAMAEHDPDLYPVATRPRVGVLRTLGIETDPVVLSPSGYLTADSIAMVEDDATVLAGDRMFSGPAPAAALVEGHRVLVTTTAVTEGGPGPGPALSSINLRQRFLSEAAVRVIRGDDRPVVWTVPREWDLRDPGTLFTGLDVPWLDLATVDEVADDAPASAVPTDDLVYPRAQQRAELDAGSFEAVSDLVRDGERLDRVLPENDQIGDVVAGQALTGVSYSMRRGQLAGRSAARQSSAWVDGVLARVGIQAPRGVTLSSSSGSFYATVTNQLDQPVRVSVVGRSDAGLELVPPEPVTLAPRSRTTVLLETRVSTPRVHDVTLLVTDDEGEPFGPADELAIRSSQVSDVIWLIMGTGAGLLFLAIVLRLVRRLRAGRTEGRTEAA